MDREFGNHICQCSGYTDSAWKKASIKESNNAVMTKYNLFAGHRPFGRSHFSQPAHGSNQKATEVSRRKVQVHSRSLFIIQKFLKLTAEGFYMRLAPVHLAASSDRAFVKLFIVLICPFSCEYSYSSLVCIGLGVLPQSTLINPSNMLPLVPHSKKF